MPGPEVEFWHCRKISDAQPVQVNASKEGGSATKETWQQSVRRWLPLSPKYYIGLLVFSFTVVGYTLIGGFLASVWTDLFQSVMMVIGVMLIV